MPELTILIPTLVDRQHLLNRLLMALEPQCIKDGKIICDILTYEDNREKTTGFKRNKLIEQCKTPYHVFIDDDDSVSHDYVSDILEALKQKPDCVTFKGTMVTDNHTKEIFELKLGYPYDAIKDAKGANFYRRWPNHICPVKTDIALQYPFEDVTFGEDYAQSKSMAESGVLKTSVHIDKILYYYNWNSKKQY